MKLRSLLWGVVAMIGVGGSAFAGAKNYGPVLINTSLRTASGSVGDARNSADSTQYIECAVQGYSASSGGSSVVVCWAQDVKRTMVSCFAFDAELRQAAAAINGDSTIQFDWDANGRCTMIQATNGSTFSPKQP